MAPFPVAYDVVVLGGGSAGCVLASRLSEDPARSVCLIEAGPDYGAYADGGWPEDLLYANELATSHDWGIAGGWSSWRAKVLGGCSAHNGCFVAWGSPADFDGWAEAGNEGWSARRARALPTSRRGDAPRSALARRGPRTIHARRARRSGRDRPAAARGLRRSPVARRDGADPGQRGGRRSVERRVRLSRSRAGEVEPHDRARRARGPAALRGRSARSGRSSASAARSSRSPPISSCWRRAPTARPRSCSAAASGRRRELAGLSIDVRADVPGVGRNLVDHPRVEVMYAPERGTPGSDARPSGRAAGPGSDLDQSPQRDLSCGHLGPAHRDVRSPFLLAGRYRIRGPDGALLRARDAARVAGKRADRARDDPGVLPIVDHGFLSDEEGQDVTTLASRHPARPAAGGGPGDGRTPAGRASSRSGGPR